MTRGAGSSAGSGPPRGKAQRSDAPLAAGRCTTATAPPHRRLTVICEGPRPGPSEVRSAAAVCISSGTSGTSQHSIFMTVRCGTINRIASSREIFARDRAALEDDSSTFPGKSFVLSISSLAPFAERRVGRTDTATNKTKVGSGRVKKVQRVKKSTPIS